MQSNQLQTKKKKVLLMGKSGSGKTSMRSIIFANYLARDTQRLNPTLDVHYSTVRFLGSLVLNLWDCGGQDAFYESYFESRRDDIFKSVAVLIYVLDVQSTDTERDLAFFSSTVRALFEFSSEAKIMVLVHKMDLVPEANGERLNALSQREAAILSIVHSVGLLDINVDVFGTSIWDETLYKAWSSVVHQLVPNVKLLEEGLENFASQGGYDEAVLFEKASFLVIASCTRKEHGDRHRFEKISNIVKQFKLIVGRGQGQFQGLRVGNKSFEVILDACGGNTYLMIVSGLKGGYDEEKKIEPRLHPSEGVVLNMIMARTAFEKLLAEV